VPATDRSQPDAQALRDALRGRVRGLVSIDQVTRGLYATDASHYQIMPACVVEPLDEADLLAAIGVAHETKTPITPRGAATSLSGQTHGPGMILDVSRHMNQTLEVNASERWARVQPGVIRDQLNRQVADLGLFLAPDPATGSRATIGGMIGNNSAGSRSVRYGRMSDHVLAMRVALPTGEVMDLRPRDLEAWRQAERGEGRAAAIYSGVRGLVERQRDEIAARFPKVMRRVSGYALDAFLEPIETKPWSLADLLVGSEGTLATVLEATVRLTEEPGGTALCVVHFDDLLASLRSVPAILEHEPSGVELLDHTVIAEAVRNPSTASMAGFLAGEPRAVLIVEFSEATEREAAERARAFAEAMKRSGIGVDHPLQLSEQEQRRVWETRKLGLGLISNVKGPIKGQAFVEDACVPVEHLADYIERLLRICEDHGLTTSVYAHASVGVLHVRPHLDLHREEHVRLMREIAEQAFEMVVGYGGSFSGEHGDGIVRGEFIRRFYGDRIYDAFRAVKGLFDPDGLMNPGKIIDPPPMTSHLRYQVPGYSQRIAEVDSNASYHYRDQGGFARAVEQCNGVGACRKIGSGVMCPSYMAAREEETNTRGRANALRLAMTGQFEGEDLTGDRVHEVLSLCLQCKACKQECPNAVDLAKLKSDALHMRHRAKGLPLRARILADLPRAANLTAGPLAPIANMIQRSAPGRALIERLTGVDRRRRLPSFARAPLSKRLKRRAKAKGEPPNGAPAAGDDGPRERVVLFDDTFTRCFEPNVGVRAVDLLEGLGFEVVVANAGCCQRPRLSKGVLGPARRDGGATLRRLDQLTSDGAAIVCLEPSCASALKDDLPDLIEDAELGARVAQRVRMLDEFLGERLDSHGIRGRLKAVSPRIRVHGHCHQKALFGVDGVQSVLGSIEGLEASIIDAGCCGMAGAFGYEHHDFSKTIGEDRLFPAVREAGADTTIVASGFSCRHQIRDFCGVVPLHLAEALRVEDAG